MSWQNPNNPGWIALLEHLHEYDRPVAKEVLMMLANPIKTGVPTQYIMPIARKILEAHIQANDIGGFVESITNFVVENFDSIDAGNRLEHDYEAESMSNLVIRYLTEVDYSKY